MRLTTIASRLPPRWRALADTLAVAAPCLFLAVIIGPALDFVEDQSFVETPALGWPDSVRAASVVTGCALMLILCVLRLLQHRLRDVLSVAAILGIIAVGLWLMAGPIVAIGNLNLLVFFVLLLCWPPRCSRSLGRECVSAFQSMNHAFHVRPGNTANYLWSTIFGKPVKGPVGRNGSNFDSRRKVRVGREVWMR
jgi:hypothetical protein